MLSGISNTTHTILKESIFIIGVVSSVEGRKVKIRVNKDKNLSHISYRGKVIKNVSVGSYVKITKGFIQIIGKVEGEYITKERVFNEEYNKEELKISRYLDVSLFGHFDKDIFKQGIKEMPLIDNECYLLDKEEFNRLHQFYRPEEKTVRIGTLTEEPSQEIKLSVAKLFASHIGIFGNTGSGKSNTLARMFTELFKVYRNNSLFITNSRFILFDFNGEYSKKKMITSKKLVYDLSTRHADADKYVIKKDNIEKLEVISVLLEATEKTQKPFLDRALRNEYLETNFRERSTLNIQKIVREIIHRGISELPYTIITEFFSHLKRVEVDSEIADSILRKLERGQLKYHATHNTYYIDHPRTIYANSDIEGLIGIFFTNLENIIIDSSNFGKIKFKILSQYYHEIINGYSNQEHIKPLIGRMFKKIEMLEKLISIKESESGHNFHNLEIINLKDVNLEMKKTLPLIISKQAYDEHKDEGNFYSKSLHIIIDEAHNILSSVSERESETWKDYRLETFEELIKEGRKFSTFITISSQRPFDISQTIISQLHNYFIHRLINDFDIKAIEKTISYLDRLSFESIPVLSVGSCFVAGLATSIPVKVDITLLPIERQPKSETIDLNQSWSID